MKMGEMWVMTSVGDQVYTTEGLLATPKPPIRQSVHPLISFSNFPRCFKASSTFFSSNAARMLARSSLTSFF